MKMKKLFVPILVVIMLLAISVSASADTIPMYYNGNRIQTTTTPITVNSRVMVPLRVVSETMGCTVQPDHSNKNKVWIYTKGHTMWIMQGSTKYYASTSGYLGNIEPNKTADVAPVLKNGVTYVPIRAISEGLGCTVNYQSRAVYIYNNSPKTNTTQTAELGLTLDNNNILLRSGETYTLLASILYTGNEEQEIFWTVSDAGVADVTNVEWKDYTYIEITGYKKGTCTITFYAEVGNKRSEYKTVTVTVTDLPTTNTTYDDEYYAEYYGVPDFGKLSGAGCLKSVTEDGMIYRYILKDMNDEQLEYIVTYRTLLSDYGFYFVEIKEENVDFGGIASKTSRMHYYNPDLDLFVTIAVIVSNDSKFGEFIVLIQEHSRIE